MIQLWPTNCPWWMAEPCRHGCGREVKWQMPYTYNAMTATTLREEAYESHTCEAR